MYTDFMWTCDARSQRSFTLIREGMTMWGPACPSMKLNEVHRLVSAVTGLLGFFILDLLAPLGIAVWIGYALPLRYVFRFSLKLAVCLPLVALACTGSIVAGYFLSLPPMNAFYAAVNRTIGILLLWDCTVLLMRTHAADEWLNTDQENLQCLEARFRVMTDAAPPLTLRHHTYSSNLLLKRGTT